MVIASLAWWVHTTTLTMRLGTTITRLGVLPSRPRASSGSARAAFSATSLAASLGNCRVPRSLPLSCTAIVTVSSTSSASSASGHGESANSDLRQEGQRRGGDAEQALLEAPGAGDA